MKFKTMESLLKHYGQLDTIIAATIQTNKDTWEKGIPSPLPFSCLFCFSKERTYGIGGFFWARFYNNKIKGKVEDEDCTAIYEQAKSLAIGVPNHKIQTHCLKVSKKDSVGTDILPQDYKCIMCDTPVLESDPSESGGVPYKCPSCLAYVDVDGVYLEGRIDTACVIEEILLHKRWLSRYSSYLETVIALRQMKHLPLQELFDCSMGHFSLFMTSSQALYLRDDRIESSYLISNDGQKFIDEATVHSKERRSIYANSKVPPLEPIAPTHNTDGGKTSFYTIDVKDRDEIDVDDISERYGFNPYEFNIFKSIVGLSKLRNNGVARHSASQDDPLRDANKACYYAQKNLELITKEFPTGKAKELPLNKAKKLKHYIIGAIEGEQEFDFWTSITFEDQVYDIHYLYDEDEVIYVYEVENDVRCEQELHIFNLTTDKEEEV